MDLLLLEVTFQSSPKVTRIEIKNDGEAHTYRLRIDDTRTFEFDIQVGDHIPSDEEESDEEELDEEESDEEESDEEESDEEDEKTATNNEQLPLDYKSPAKKELDDWLRSFRSPGVPKLTLRYVSAEGATEEDKAKNRADWRYHLDLINELKTALDGPTGARKHQSELIEGPEDPQENNILAVAREIRIIFKRLQEELAIKHRNLRRTRAYSHYLIQGQAPTRLDGVSGSPVVRIVGRGQLAPLGLRVAKPVTTYETEIQKYGLFEEAWTQRSHAFGVLAVAFSPDGKRIASASEDRTIRIWDSSNGANRWELVLNRPAFPYSIAFSPDEKKLVIGDHTGPVWLWDVRDGDDGPWDVGEGDDLSKITEHINATFAVAYSPDGNLIASAGWDNTVKVWKVRNNLYGYGGGMLYELKGHEGVVSSVAFSPGGEWIVSGSKKSVYAWDLATGEQRWELKGLDYSVNSLAFSPDGTRIVGGMEGGQVLIWDSVTKEQVGELKGHGSRVNSVVFSPDGTEIVSGSDDFTVRIWDSATGEQLQELTGAVDVVNSVAFSPDGKQIVAGGEDRVLRVWRRD